MIMSSIYAWHIFLISGSNTRVIYYWCIAKAFTFSMGITIYLYIPKEVLTIMSIILL